MTPDNSIFPPGEFEVILHLAVSILGRKLLVDFVCPEFFCDGLLQAILESLGAQPRLLPIL